ncbi:Cyclin-dependent kinase-like 3 [Merluccius polli]|uniref:Cyclin-dependent kinase-like 3 n=1 Tax=Merluccius polli TaxID=89951 RepID=A0AA47NRC3_MERPO|nr:Cyclin-dependent kinase-like 3 [Merluccius polli]
MQQQPNGLESQLLRKYTFQILRGIEYLHSVNVLHRDIKPDNLLVSSSGVVKVADLGGGRVVAANRGQNLTLVVGTLWYLPPEVLTGDCCYYKSRDVWAIGCTFLGMAKSTAFLPGNLIWLYRKWYPEFKVPAPELPPANLLRKYQVSDRLLAQLIEESLQMYPDCRATCSELLGHRYFTRDSFHQRFSQELAEMVQADQHAALLQPLDQPQTTDLSICPSKSMEADKPDPSMPNLLQDVPPVMEAQVESALDIIVLNYTGQDCLHPGTAGPHKASCCPEIPPALSSKLSTEIPPEISPELSSEIPPELSSEISSEQRLR